MHREFQERVFPMLEIEGEKQLSQNRAVGPVFYYCFQLDDERATGNYFASAYFRDRVGLKSSVKLIVGLLTPLPN
jgi:hypothetical protein